MIKKYVPKRYFSLTKMIWLCVFYLCSGGQLKNNANDLIQEIETQKEEHHEIKHDTKKIDEHKFFMKWDADRKEAITRGILVWNRSLTPVDQIRKYCAIKKDPFYFLRGTNHIFYHDMRSARQADKALIKYSATTWIQGDLHSMNYGAFDDSNGHITYNINDFDEAVISDYQYDIWRFCVSIILEFALAKNITSTEMEPHLTTFIQAYLDTVALSSLGFQHTPFRLQNVVKPMRKFLTNVRSNFTQKRMLDKWAPVDPRTGHRKFSYRESKGKLGPPPDDIVTLFTGEGLRRYYDSLTIIAKSMIPFSDLKIKDIGMRNLAGTGSLGSNRFYVLLEGPSKDEDDDIILDVKEQGRPAPYYYMGIDFMRKYNNDFGSEDAKRHNEAMSSLIRFADPYMGYFRCREKNTTYSVRHRSPWKETIKLSDYEGEDLTLLLQEYARMIASDHCQASQRQMLFGRARDNKAPPGFAANVTRLLNLKAHIPFIGQSSDEVKEFVDIAVLLSQRYAARTIKDHQFFVDNFEDISGVNCTQADIDEMRFVDAFDHKKLVLEKIKSSHSGATERIVVEYTVKPPMKPGDEKPEDEKHNSFLPGNSRFAQVPYQEAEFHAGSYWYNKGEDSSLPIFASFSFLMTFAIMLWIGYRYLKTRRQCASQDDYFLVT